MLRSCSLEPGRGQAPPVPYTTAATDHRVAGYGRGLPPPWLIVERQGIDMSIEIRVPELGESIVDAVIATWLKHEGDAINTGDALVELETDKVNVEVSAQHSGVLQKIMKKEGDEVAVGDVIGMIG